MYWASAAQENATIESVEPENAAIESVELDAEENLGILSVMPKLLQRT